MIAENKNYRVKKWRDEFYVRIYEMAKQGLAERQWATALNVNPMTMRKWCREKPALVDAIKRATVVNSETGGNTFRDYIYKRLSSRLRKVWDELQSCEDSPNAVERINALFQRHGKRARQHLFLYALVAKNFNTSEACRSVNISRTTFSAWCTESPDFAELIDEMHLHKKNFYEEGLVRLVKMGDPSAIIFANRTYNKDRGYNDKIDIAVGGEITHNHNHVHLTVDDLDLPLDVRRLILEKLRDKQQGTVLTLEAPRA